MTVCKNRFEGFDVAKRQPPADILRHIDTRQIADEIDCTTQSVVNSAKRLGIGEQRANRSWRFSGDEAEAIKADIRPGPGQPPKYKS